MTSKAELSEPEIKRLAHLIIWRCEPVGQHWSYPNSLHLKHAKDLVPTGYRAEVMREVGRQMNIRMQRRRHREIAWPIKPLAYRLERHLLLITDGVMWARGCTRPTGWRTTAAQVTDRDIASRTWLVHKDYKHHYSRRAGDWWTGASYVCGFDDHQRWCVRVPRRITTVREALDHLKPAAVKRAEAQGKPVIRQGDVYLVRERDCAIPFLLNPNDLPGAHVYIPGRWENSTECAIEHAEHQPVYLRNGKWRVYRQRSLAQKGNLD